MKERKKRTNEELMQRNEKNALKWNGNSHDAILHRDTVGWRKCNNMNDINCKYCKFYSKNDRSFANWTENRRKYYRNEKKTLYEI